MVMVLPDFELASFSLSLSYTHTHFAMFSGSGVRMMAKLLYYVIANEKSTKRCELQKCSIVTVVLWLYIKEKFMAVFFTIQIQMQNAHIKSSFSGKICRK